MSRDEMVQRYADGWSLERIAQAKGCSRQWVHRVLVLRNVPRRTRREAAQRHEAMRCGSVSGR